MEAASGPSRHTSARIVMQCCTKAMLRLTESDSGDAAYALANEGIIVYVAFLKGAVEDAVKKIAKVICHTKICSRNEELVSILELPGDIVLIPHFCLGGRLKGNRFQYHAIAPRDQAEVLFRSLFCECKEICTTNTNWLSSNKQVFAGTYGIRQVLSYESNGPFTHVVEI
uniref:D-aminoacyl-tRNA deacylase n=1 Tax=Schistocephalus solidus TaxID=70667 RepID=A0A0X3P4K4_SCHSO